MVAIEYCQNSSATAATSTSNQLNTVILSPTSSATSTASTTTTNSTNILPPAALQHHNEPESLHPKSPIPIAKDSKQTSLTKATTKTKMSDQQIATETATSASANTNRSAVSQRSVDVHLPDQQKANSDTNVVTAQQLSKKVLKLDLSGKDLQDFSMKSPKSPISARLPHQVSLTSSVDVEDRKTLREALYQGIFHRHRKTIFAMGSFLRMLRSRNSQYNTIRSSSEGEDVDEPR